MFGAQVAADGAGFRCFVVEAVFVPGESERICLNVFLFSFRQTRNNRRIDPAAEKNAKWNVADKLALDGRRKRVLNLQISDFRRGWIRDPRGEIRSSSA